MKHTRPRQHRRRLSSGKSIVVNKGVPKNRLPEGIPSKYKKLSNKELEQFVPKTDIFNEDI